MLDHNDELIYVGMSGKLRRRLVTYFYNTTHCTKEQQVARCARKVVWETSSHELLATHRELELIRRWRPWFNELGQPQRARSGYVFLTSDEAAHLRVDRFPPRHCVCSWGPVPLNWRMRTAVEMLNLVFKLRDCPRTVRMYFADQRELFPQERPAQCPRSELGTCLAPCAARCTSDAYRRQVALAKAFLDGHDNSMLDGIDYLSHPAVRPSDSESAAATVDIRESLTYLREQLELAADVRRNYRFVYPVTCHTGETIWIAIANGRIVEVTKAPDSRLTGDDAQERHLVRLFGTGNQHRDDLEMMRLVTSWFRQHPDELSRTLDANEAIEYCQRQREAVYFAAA